MNYGIFVQFAAVLSVNLGRPTINNKTAAVNSKESPLIDYV